MPYFQTKHHHYPPTKYYQPRPIYKGSLKPYLTKVILIANSNFWTSYLIVTLPTQATYQFINAIKFNLFILFLKTAHNAAWLGAPARCTQKSGPSARPYNLYNVTKASPGRETDREAAAVAGCC